MKTKKKKTTEQHKTDRLKLKLDFAKYCATLIVLLGLIVWAPSQAAQFTGYLGAFILGGSKARALLGL